MSRPLPDNNPFRMNVPTRRDGLTGEAATWYDRADWLRAVAEKRTLKRQKKQAAAAQRAAAREAEQARKTPSPADGD